MARSRNSSIGRSHMITTDRWTLFSNDHIETSLFKKQTVLQLVLILTILAVILCSLFLQFLNLKRNNQTESNIAHVVARSSKAHALRDTNTLWVNNQ